MEGEAYGAIYRIEEDLWWYKGRRTICFGLLERYFRAGSGLEILDVGCGTGYNLELLRRYGCAKGVDTAPEALEFCRQRGVEDVILHEAEELPFPDESFDLVTAFDVLEHIEDDRSALLEMKRVLRPGGRLLIYTPALPWLFSEHDRRVHHKRRYMLAELREKVLAAGFKLDHLSYVNLFVLPGVLAIRLLSWLVPRSGHVEMILPAKPVNWFCTTLCDLEKPFVFGPGLPLGMSLVALAQKT